VDRDELNARLDEVLVGGREPVRVCLIEYDPAWPARFERERARIARALEAKAIRIEHIGSTSWEDMNHYAAAKGPLIAEIVGGAAAA
jgi:GrpB-like predicted nucleotidyltransferase (UPF0157 family)